MKPNPVDELAERMLYFHQNRRVTKSIDISKREDVEDTFSWVEASEQHLEVLIVNKTFVDHLSGLLFRSAFLAKLVMDSPLSPPIYKVVALLRNSREQDVVSDLGGISGGFSVRIDPGRVYAS